MDSTINVKTINSSNQLYTQNEKSPSFILKILLLILSLITFSLLVAVIVLGIKLKNKLNDYNDLEEQNLYFKQSLINIFDIFQNLIKTTNITNQNIERKDNVGEKIKLAHDLSDGTYDLDTFEEITDYSDGYQLAFETSERNYENGYYNDKEYDDLVYKIASILNISANLGVYDNNPEISYYVKDKNVSLAIAALFNQMSIWDWKYNKEVFNEFHQ